MFLDRRGILVFSEDMFLNLLDLETLWYRIKIPTPTTDGFINFPMTPFLNLGGGGGSGAIIYWARRVRDTWREICVQSH